MSDLFTFTVIWQPTFDVKNKQKKKKQSLFVSKKKKMYNNQAFVMGPLSWSLKLLASIHRISSYQSILQNSLQNIGCTTKKQEQEVSPKDRQQR